MKQLILLLIVFSLRSLPILSQSTAQQNSNVNKLSQSEINLYLAEGLECKELIHQKIRTIHVLDSMGKVRDAIDTSYVKEIRNHLYIEKKLTAENTRLTEKNANCETSLNAETNRKKGWRAAAITEAGVVVLVLILVLL